MVKSFAMSASLVALLLVAAGDVQAGIFRHHRNNQPAASQPAVAPQAATASPGANYQNRSANVWPGYPNYGNPVGAAYSAAAGLRPGQFFGTFGLRPADARARGAY